METNKLTSQISCWFDGGCWPNPGPSAIGIVVRNNNSIIWSHSQHMGDGTNNKAEYNALITLLEWLDEHNYQHANIYGDSKLIIMQSTGQWQCKNDSLKPYYEKAQHLVNKTLACLTHVPRLQNKDADALATIGLNSYAQEMSTEDDISADEMRAWRLAIDIDETFLPDPATIAPRWP